MSRLRSVFGCAATVLLMFSDSASAVVQWSETGGGNWSVATNWIGELPGVADEVRIDSGGVAKLTQPTRLRGAMLGYRPESEGLLEVFADLSLSKVMVVGRGGAGTLSISSGAEVDAGECVHIGFLKESDGRIILEGEGSRLHSGGALFVGRDGAAFLRIGKGACVSVDGSLKINAGETANECKIGLYPGGMLALNDRSLKGETLADFLDLVSGTGNIQYLQGGRWANITSGREGINYRLNTEVENGKSYRKLTLLKAPALRLASVFSDNMVFQQRSNAGIWGWAKAGDQITIRPGWTNSPVVAVAGSDGKWRASVPTPEASAKQYNLVVCDGAGHTLRLSNVLIGQNFFNNFFTPDITSKWKYGLNIWFGSYC